MPDFDVDSRQGSAPDKRFGRCCRLTSPSEYKLVFDGQYKSSGSVLAVRARKNGCDSARLGLVISKKSVKAAVGRNRIKRLTRESFRQHRARLAGLDVVVMSRAGAADVPNDKIFAILSRHWEALERWKKS
ncbi:MAG: ribonuclease P protein component [Rubrivivax sp.]|jgi:ribonuclease P protein component